MNDTFKILTCKAKGRAHQETTVSIDWTGMDEEHLRVLARSCIIYALQKSWKKDTENPIPENAPVRAVDFVKGQLHEVLEDRPPLPKKVDWMDKLLGDMSRQERELLMASLPDM